MKFRAKNIIDTERYSYFAAFSLFLTLIIGCNKCSAELHVTSSDQELTIDEPSTTTTAEPSRESLSSDEGGNFTSVAPSSTSEPFLLDGLPPDSSILNKGSSGEENSTDINLLSLEQNERVGHVKRRAIRSLIQVLQ